MKILIFLMAVLATQFAFADPINSSRITIRDRTGNDATYKRLINNKLLRHPRYKNKKFRQVIVKEVKKQGKKYLVAHLKAKNVYHFETAVVSLKTNNTISRIEPNVSNIRLRTLVRFPGLVLNLCPDNSVDVVFATPEDGIPTAVTGVEEACNSAEAAGYTCRTLIGDEATVKAYKAYLLHCPKLKALGNIGHGNTGGILLHDGTLNHGWFTSLANNKLKGEVLYFNSCKVHNNPLDGAIMSAGTRTYVGGNVNLSIGSSEEVFKCFWDDVLRDGKTMKPALENCEDIKYHTDGAHGFSGYQGKFKPLIIRPFPRPVIPRPVIPRPIPRPFPIPRPRVL